MTPTTDGLPELPRPCGWIASNQSQESYFEGVYESDDADLGQPRRGWAGVFSSDQMLAFRAEGIRVETEKLRAELEAAKDDARRYRWLREHTVATGLERFVGVHKTQFLDEAIDAAISKDHT